MKSIKKREERKRNLKHLGHEIKFGRARINSQKWKEQNE